MSGDAVGLPVELRKDARELAIAISRQLEPTARELSEYVLAQVPELGGDDPEVQENAVQTAAALVGSLSALARDGVAPEGMVAPAAALDMARIMVRRGVSLTLLLRAYHVGQAKLWHQWTDGVFASKTDPARLAELLRWSTDFISSYLDAVRESVADAYEQERERWTQSVAAAREAALRRLLAGEERDADRAGAELAYDLRRHHIALVLWRTQTDRPAGELALLVAAAERLVAAVSTGPGLIRVSPGGSVWAWASSYAHFPRDTHDDLARVAVDLPVDVRVAVGEPALGIEGLRMSHEQALLAVRVAGLGVTGPLARYRDHALAALVCADPARARDFARFELGRLAADDDNTARLRATLATYLSTGRSIRAAAQRLGVHEKTVVYRLRRCDELLGHPVGERQPEMAVALLIYDRLRAA